jgi:hypothetical protein
MSGIPIGTIYRDLGGKTYSGHYDGKDYIFEGIHCSSISGWAMTVANHHFKDTVPHYINGWNVVYILRGGSKVYAKTLRTKEPKPRPRTPPKARAAPKPPKKDRKPKPAAEDYAPPPPPPRAFGDLERHLAALDLTMFELMTAMDKMKVIKAARRTMSLRFHPDKVGAAVGEEQMKRINVAYEYLSELYA